MRHETLLYLVVSFAWIAVISAVAATLTGCESAKYLECVARDNTRNPCN